MPLGIYKWSRSIRLIIITLPLRHVRWDGMGLDTLFNDHNIYSIVNEPTVAYLGFRHRGGTFVTGVTLVLYADKILSKVID